MSIKEWQIGRLIRSSISNIPIVVTSVTLASTSKQRVGIIISNTSLDNLWVNVDAPAVANRGLPFNGNDIVREFSLKDHGDFPQREFNGIYTAAGGVVFVVELFLSEKALTLSHEELHELGLA